MCANRPARAALILAFLAPFGCSRGPEVAPPPAGREAPARSEKSYPLKGVVRKLDRGSGEVTIAHEAVSGFMPAMVMPFSIKDKASLEEVQPGDEVEGSLRVVSEGGSVRDYELSALIVTRPYLARSIYALIPAAPR